MLREHISQASSGRFSHGESHAGFRPIRWQCPGGPSFRKVSFHYKVPAEIPTLARDSVGKEAGIQAHRTLQVKTLSGNVHVSLEKEGPCFSRSNHSWKLTHFIHALSICHLLGKLNLVQKFL